MARIYQGGVPIGSVSSIPRKRYGATLENIIGEPDADGVLQSPDTPTDLTFTGVKTIGYRGLYSKFCRSTSDSGKGSVNSISFPDLETVETEGMRYMLQRDYKVKELNLPKLKTIGVSGLQYVASNSSLESADLSSLETIDKSSALYSAFQSSYLSSLNLSSLKEVTGYQACTYMASDSKLTSVALPELTTISGYQVFSDAFRASSLTSISFPKLETIDGEGAMSNMLQFASISSLSFPSLTTISMDTYRYNTSGALVDICMYCSNLTSVTFPELTTITGNLTFSGAFVGCESLTTLSFPKLQIVGGSTTTREDNGHFYRMLNYVSGITSLTFPELTAIYATGSSTTTSTFSNNNYIQKLYFPKLSTITYSSNATSANTVSCNYLFAGCTALTEIHFSSDNQSAIEATTGYNTAWGVPNSSVQIYFDL